jgi:HK97 family phage portal protein
MNIFQRAGQRIVNMVRQLRPGEQRVYNTIRQAGVVVTEDTAMTFAAVWACVSVISRTLAALPWQVFERSPEGRRQLHGTVGWLLNNQPNPEMTAFSFRETLISHALLWGNGYAEIVFDMAGRPSALWPLSPDRVTVQRNESTGELEYKHVGERLTIYLPASRVLHLHGLGFDGLVGHSVVRMAARSVGMGMAQDRFGQAFFQNGTVMGAVLEIGASMNPVQISQMENDINTRHRGPDAAFRVKVAPPGTKVHNPTMPLVDAQFLESRKYSATEICRWYGVPPHKIADLQRSTDNNIEHQGIEFVQDVVVPWSVRLEQEANIKLFGQRAQGRVYTKLAVNALMRGDSKTRAEYYKTMMQLGVYSINEIRAMEEENGIGPDGDVRLVQLNQTTLEYLVANPGRAEPAAPAAADIEDLPDLDDPDAEPEPSARGAANNVIRIQALEFIRKHA